MAEADEDKICFVSILPRPKEDYEYEKSRRYINRRIWQNIKKINGEMWENNSEKKLKIIDVDYLLNEDMFSFDHVHLNNMD